MDRALAVHQPQFALTVTFDYITAQVTLTLALLIFILGRIALQMENAHYGRSTHFWTKVFAINFVLGVVTVIRMEFQLGSNWSGFAKVVGSVIGQTLAMEECSAFLWRVRFLSYFFRREEAAGRANASLAIKDGRLAPSLSAAIQR